MTYTWDKAGADAPTRHATQYFEMFGSRAIYHDGWVAAAPPLVPPWELGKPSPPPAAYSWQLYNTADDWTENNDLAQKEPDKLRDLQNLFTSEAAKFNVFPLSNDTVGRFVAPRPGPNAGRNVFTYSGELANVGWGAAPSLLDQSYTITADIDVPQGGAEGMLVTGGGRFGGYGFYLLKGRPVFTWNVLALAITQWAGPDALAPGKHTLVFDFKYDGGGFGKGGQGVLRVDGKDVATKRMEKTIPFLMQFDEAFNVGLDTGTAVEPEDYAIPFRFTGKINKLTIQLNGPPLSQEKQEEMQRRQNKND
jgi:arylsulfatase